MNGDGKKLKTSAHTNLSDDIDDLVDDLFSELSGDLDPAETSSAPVAEELFELPVLTGITPPEPEKEMTVSDTCSSAGVESQSALEKISQYKKVIDSNLVLLQNCVERITMLELLFQQTPGYKKLYSATKNLRELLRFQEDCFKRALESDFTQKEHPPLFPARSWTLAKKPFASANNIPPPIDSVLLAKWQGSPAAFLHEEMAHMSGEAIVRASKYANADSYPFKNLKRHPWSKLQPLFFGELARKSEPELEKMEVPILQHPGVLEAFNEPLPKSYLLILHNGSTGGAVFLDSRVKQVTISSQWRWRDENKKDTNVKGYFITDGMYIPLITLKGLI
ncbi:MAG: hypothetical protein OEV64_09320 [Desulfobulbaceae bacterium]|nr:hypothetical protein [Desulfobulbaceae bacterium]